LIIRHCLCIGIAIRFFNSTKGRCLKFIVFEGLDGAGKSTLMHKVESYLSGQKLTPVFIRDPGTTRVGEKLRQIILDPAETPAAKTEILMYQAARAQLVDEVIEPSLKKGHWVLSDRFYSSTIAFQCHARGLSRADVDWLSNYACNGLKPDTVIFIDISIEESQRRVHQRTSKAGENKDRMESENVEFHEKVREGYLLQAREQPGSWLVLDGLRTPDQLLDDVVGHFRSRKWLA
jgi:dTMP kinase